MLKRHDKKRRQILADTYRFIRYAQRLKADALRAQGRENPRRDLRGNLAPLGLAAEVNPPTAEDAKDPRDCRYPSRIPPAATRSQQT